MLGRSMKSFLLALSMLTLGSVASAQSSGQARGLERSSADTLITLTQDELLRAVRAVAEARLAIESPQRSQTAVGLSASDLHVLKLQLLLNALGLGAVPPAEPSALAPQPAPITQPGSVNYLSVHPQVATAPAYSSQPSNARLDRLEQLMLLMLQQRNATWYCPELRTSAPEPLAGQLPLSSHSLRLTKLPLRVATLYYVSSSRSSSPCVRLNLSKLSSLR